MLITPVNCCYIYIYSRINEANYDVTLLPLTIYNGVSRPREEFVRTSNSDVHGWPGNDGKDGQAIRHYVSSKNGNIIPGGPGHRLRIENGLFLIRMLRRRAGHLPLAPSRSDTHIDRKKKFFYNLLARGQRILPREGEDISKNMHFKGSVRNI